ncbi:MAG: alpha/beta hydrolase [Actinomycetota bacterium]
MRASAGSRADSPSIDPKIAIKRKRLLAAAIACIIAGLVTLGVSRVWVRWSLLHGPFPMLIQAAGLALFLATLARRGKRWWTRTVPVIVVISSILALMGAKALRSTDYVTESYPRSFIAWFAASVLTIVAAPIGFKAASMLVRTTRLIAIPLSMATAFLLINSHYGYWPTLGDLVGSHVPGQVSAQALDAELAAGNVPPAGVVATFDPVATISHFRHRAGYIYLPPAFFNHPHDQFPVLEMLGGEPGAPSDWLRAGLAAQTANAYAKAHQGFGPVMIFVDENGGPTRDTECVDGPRGRSETYVTTDVPRGAIAKFGLSTEPGRWGIVGFSEGGTCAFDAALRHPYVFGHFMDLAGDDAPRLWSYPVTLRFLFGGSIAKMQSYDTGRILFENRYRGMTGWFGAGKDDGWDVHQMRNEANAATHSGIPSHVILVPGQAHSWAFGATAFQEALPTLLLQMGLKPDGTFREPPFPIVYPSGSVPPSPRVAPKAPPKKKTATVSKPKHHPSPSPSSSPKASASPSPLL